MDATTPTQASGPSLNVTRPAAERPDEPSLRPIKLLGKVAGLIWALPHLLMYAIGVFTMGREKAFRSASERIAAVPGMLGVYARQWFYFATLDEVGGDVYFGYMSMFSKPGVTIGDRVYIGRFCSVGWADLGDDAMLSDGVQVLSGAHQHGGGTRAGGVVVHTFNTFTKVVVGPGAWIGTNAVVMAHVGPSAIVGAGAVVTRLVDAGERVGGVPAKPLRVGGLASSEPAQAA
jgi:hypothetical protein